MTEEKSTMDNASRKFGPVQITLRDLLIIFVWIGAFLGLLAQLMHGQPSMSVIWILFLVWIGLGIGLLLIGTRRHSCLLQLLGGSTFVVFCCWCLPRFNFGVHPASRRVQCNNNLKQIALGLQLYHDKYGCFPPAYVADEQGRPMHSWRVLLLPFIEHRKLYEKYDFSEPWDGPNNSLLAAQIPDCYVCPGRKVAPAIAPLTSYLAVVGQETAWPGATSIKLSDMVDGTSQTILVVESSAASVPWMEPRDLDFQVLPLQINAKAGRGISSEHPSGIGANVAFADGSVTFLLDKTCSPEQLRAMLTIAGGEQIALPH
jgi:prepilin-type processing-associated H-X9-DG protein